MCNYRENTVAGSDVAELVSYQEFSIGGFMDAQGFVAALTPAVTDANARERFLADPRATLTLTVLDPMALEGSVTVDFKPSKFESSSQVNKKFGSCALGCTPCPSGWSPNHSAGNELPKKC